MKCQREATTGQSKRVLRSHTTQGGRSGESLDCYGRAGQPLPAWRSPIGCRVLPTLAVAVTSPPTLAACQSPGVTLRHTLALGETVRQMRTLLFFWPTRPHALPGAGWNSRQPYAYGVPLLTKGHFGNPCWKSRRRLSRLRTGGAFRCGCCGRGSRDRPGARLNFASGGVKSCV